MCYFNFCRGGDNDSYNRDVEFTWKSLCIVRMAFAVKVVMLIPYDFRVLISLENWFSRKGIVDTASINGFENV